jgi:DNA-binding NarL/FixJ family response regulator
MPIRVLLAEDHTLFAQALKLLLEPRCEILEIVSDGKALQTAARKHKPDVIVADITMPSMSGLDGVRALGKDASPAKVIFLTMHGDSELARECFSSGASAFVTKESSHDDLLVAIDTVMANHTYISPTVAAELIDPEKPASPSKAGFEPLTMRQREILQLFAEGKTMKEIATMTNLSTRTVEWHKYRMMKMLNIRRSSQLIQHAVRMKLVI